ncbi:hypothetical protein GA0115253_104611, partial [Streptomyces sp. Termitarium-T10T-6]
PDTRPPWPPRIRVGAAAAPRLDDPRSRRGATAMTDTAAEAEDAPEGRAAATGTAPGNPAPVAATGAPVDSAPVA